MRTKTLSVAMAFLLFALGSFTISAQDAATKEVATMATAPVSYQVSTENSSLGWVGKKVTGQHNGNIKITSGDIRMADHHDVSGKFEIDMTSISVTDLEGDMAAKLAGHLSSDDFFAVEKYPTATFELKGMSHLKAEAAEGEEMAPNHEVTGDLTIKGVTNEITFPAYIEHSANSFKAQAKFMIDRTKWGLQYGSGSFIKGLGDKMIYDDIEFELSLSANSAP